MYHTSIEATFAILRDLSTWSVADINQAGRSKTVRNTNKSNSNELYFNSSGKIWNRSLNLLFLHPHATISSNNSNTTTSVRIPLVDSTVRNNLCHPSFDSNVKYESNNITASSSRQYHASILIFWSTRTVTRKRSPCLPHEHDRWPAAAWKQYNPGGVGDGLIVIRYSNTCLKSFSTPSLNSGGMLRGTDNFYFILITFSFKLELVLINRVINIFLTGVPIWPFCLSSVV